MICIVIIKVDKTFLAMYEIDIYKAYFKDYTAAQKVGLNPTFFILYFFNDRLVNGFMVMG